MKGRFLLKQFIFFSLSLIVLFILSVILIVVLNFNIVINSNSKVHPVQIYNEIKENNDITVKAKSLMNDNDIWLVWINKDGDVIKSHNKPHNIAEKFSITDIARFTRWYLKDYPVFTYVLGDDLIVIAYPKDSYGKFFSNYFLPNETFKILKNMLVVAVVDIVLLFLLYTYSKKSILKEVTPIRKAIKQLSKGEVITQKKCNNLSDILDELVMASDIIEQKNMSKNKWIRGITHDIRTPLTVIIGNCEQLIEDEGIIDEQSKLYTIKSKAILINKILESFNTMYLLEDKSGIKNEKIDLSKLIKKIAIDYINTYNVDIDVNIPNEPVFMYAKEVLIERLIRNILDNSIKHNDESVSININLKDDRSIVISDNGKITDSQVQKLNQVTDIYNTKENGYGIIIVKKIASIYDGEVDFATDGSGLTTVIKL